MSDFMKSLSRIAIPVTLQSMLQASFSIIDQIMIGQLGEVNIAAVGLYGNFSLIFSVVIGSVGTVAGILIAQFTGADNEREAWCSLNVSLLCGALLSVLFLLAAGGFPAQILQLYTADRFAAAEFPADFTGLCGLPQKGWQSSSVDAAF